METGMLKVMLVDDEPLIRQGMKLIIDWEAYGYEIAAEAENGFEALDILQKKEIDLVFADLKMPEMSGIEFMQRVREYEEKEYGRRKMQFVVLTGYADFHYAKQAIRLSVRDYLLKPVREEELICLLGQFRAECLRRQDTSEERKEGNGAEPKDGEKKDADVWSEQEMKKTGDLLEDVEQYILENYDQNISLKSLGEQFFINNVYLGQIFKKKFGIAFRDYLNRVRMEQAAALLESTDDKIYAIAEKVGFSNVDYFINKFIQEKNITPRRYRMEKRKEDRQ